MSLEIVERDLDSVRVLELSGQLTVNGESEELREKVKDVLNQGRTRLVLDFAKVGYMDSTGLGALVASHTTARNQGASIKLANLGNKFRDQLKVTKLITVFEVYGSVEEATKSFG